MCNAAYARKKLGEGLSFKERRKRSLCLQQTFLDVFWVFWVFSLLVIVKLYRDDFKKWNGDWRQILGLKFFNEVHTNIITSLNVSFTIFPSCVFHSNSHIGQWRELQKMICTSTIERPQTSHYKDNRSSVFLSSIPKPRFFLCIHKSKSKRRSLASSVCQYSPYSPP